MRIPKINKNLHTTYNDDIITEKIDIELLERVNFQQNIDPEDTKKFPKIIKAIKNSCRSSFEYKSLVNFLKSHMDMNRSFIYKGIKKSQERKFSIEIHHSPFVLEDIVVTVIFKRITNGESLSFTDIADEIMYLHYSGLIGLVPLDKTTHALIHSEAAPEVFLPIQFIPFGDFHKFYSMYKSYMPENIKTAYNYLQDLSMKYDRLKDVIPQYMQIKKLYYEGFIKMDTFKEVLDKISA